MLQLGYFISLFFRLNQIEDFTSLPFHPLHDKHCDIVVEKPSFFMKLDAGLFRNDHLKLL